MSASDPVLVVSHEASRTGAVLQLLTVLRQWERDGRRFEVIIRRPGPLQAQFEALAPTTCLTPSWAVAVRRPFDRGRHAGVFDGAMLALSRVAGRSMPYRAILLNTATNGDVVNRLPPRPTTTWCHEQGSFLRRLTRPKALAALATGERRVVAVSESVRRDVASLTSISVDRIPIVRPSPVALVLADPKRARRQLCESLGLGPDTVIVGASGVLSWVKSPESFLELAQLVAAGGELPRPVAFVWLGDGRTPSVRAGLQRTAADRHLTNVHFLGAWEDPAPFFAALDLFVVVSTTDAFPIVALEAAQAGAPVICFGDTGGIGEFVGDDAGVVIPTRDLSRMAAVVVRLARDSAERAGLAAVAARRVRDDYQPTVTATRLWNLLVGSSEQR